MGDRTSYAYVPSDKEVVVGGLLTVQQLQEDLVAEEGILSEAMRRDIEESVAEALSDDDLRASLEALAPDLGPVSEDEDEVDLVVLWVYARRRYEWSKMWSESDSLRPLIDGFVVASIQAHDLASGRDPADRRLRDHQRRWLERWKRQSALENP